MYAVVLFAVQFVLAWIFPTIQGYSGWLLLAFILGRFIGIDHPPCLIEVPLNPARKLLAWLAVLIFIFSFTPAPLVIY